MMPRRTYRRVSAEVREAAVAQVNQLVSNMRSESEACRAVADQIGVHENSVRNWVRAAGSNALDRLDNAALRRRVVELERKLAAAGELNRSLADTLNENQRFA